MTEPELTREDLEDELMASCNPFMQCTLCESIIDMGDSREDGYKRMKDHFIKKHEYKEADG